MNYIFSKDKKKRKKNYTILEITNENENPRKKKIEGVSKWRRRLIEDAKPKKNEIRNKIY